MKRHSLYTIIFGISLVLIAVSFVSIYFSVSLHAKDLLETAIEEKTRLAFALNEIVAAPHFVYETAKFPVFEMLLFREAAKFKDVRYIRVVELDGSIHHSSIEGEWGKTIRDLDIEKAVTTKKAIVKDEIFEGEKLKTIIYPGYKNQTIWVAFTLKGIEEAIKVMWIRDIAIALGELMIMISILFIIFRGTIINPLKKMTIVCGEIRKGNLEVKTGVKAKTEIGELAVTLDRTTEELKKSKAALEESKEALEIKIEARTRELRELTESLDEKVRERTKEIQERMEELERFYKLTIGRELRMMGLKEENKKLKEEIDRLKKELEPKRKAGE